ncbi:MAG: ribonuclease J [Clostridia bacterium]|nr:ribonuclease J [Clostridia bacterium]
MNTEIEKKETNKTQTQKKPIKTKDVNQKATKTQPQQKTATAKTITVGKNSKEKLKITFLGGVGEIGKNMTAFEYKDEMIIVDAGLTFPDGDLPGVDIVVPDISYLVNNKSKVKAVVLTHGHEDHIGGLPFLLPEINVPVYGSRLTLGLVENKLKEHPKIKAKLISVKPKNVLKIGNFAIEFIHVNHSIAGALALCITTPAGNVVHTGDFKIDFEAINGQPTDIERFGELGKRGVDLLMCESTNVCRKGYSMSERRVGETLDRLFAEHKENRLFVATFASNIHRLQQIMDLAEKYKRKIAFTGRSMINVSEVAMKLGELKYNKENVIDIDKVDKFSDKELLIITTGSQGEPMSALTRMAANEFKKITLGENDCIIISASPIPGNEKPVYNVINKLYKKGADVIYDELADVHASGHACQEEIKIIHALVKPKCFMPVHGEYRHLKTHKEIATALGCEARNIILPDIGMQVELCNGHIKEYSRVQAGQRLVDGLGIGDMDSSVLRDRKQLSEDGICVAVLNLSAMSGEMTSEPFLITRGVVYSGEQETFMQDTKELLINYLKDQDVRDMDPNLIKQNIRRVIQNFIYKRTARRPMILTIILFD